MSMIVGPVEYDVELVSIRQKKWDEVRRIVDQLKPVQAEKSNSGWARVPILTKEDAACAGTSCTTYAREILHAKDQGWRLQTSVRPAPDGRSYLCLRKIWVK